MNQATDPVKEPKKPIFDPRLYLAQTLDPVHVGTGEFQLGRVDNTIVREAGTNLPKIPGSSLAGVVRAYMAMSYKEKENCAGKGGPDGSDHCGKRDCPVCVAHGFSKKVGSFQGLVQFSDARILFFPVYTLQGPMWVTSPATLESAGVSCGLPEWNDVNAKLREGNDHQVCTPGRPAAVGERINLGWLYLEIKPMTNLGSAKTWTFDLSGEKVALSQLPRLAPMLPLIVIVDDELFSMIVEDQLEVRTSVSIDPKTGTAARGALFTAEAIPRGTYLYFHVTAMEPKFFRIPGDKEPIDFTPSTLHASVFAGLKLMEYLGVGGSGTRGLGRTRVIEVKRTT